MGMGRPNTMVDDYTYKWKHNTQVIIKYINSSRRQTLSVFVEYLAIEPLL